MSYAGSGLPLGRPRWVQAVIWAPVSRSHMSVGRAARILKSSATTPLAVGRLCDRDVEVDPDEDALALAGPRGPREAGRPGSQRADHAAPMMRARSTRRLRVAPLVVVPAEHLGERGRLVDGDRHRERRVERARGGAADDVARDDLVLVVDDDPAETLGLGEAARKASLISSAPTWAPSTAVRSVIEPSATGTRSVWPSSRPFIASSTRLVDRAAPVVDGMMLTAAARARRRLSRPRSSTDWSLV